MDLYFLQDQGDALVYNDGIAYEFVEQTVQVPNASGAQVIEGNISSFNFSIADAQLKTAYTAGEHALAFYVDENKIEVDMPLANTWYTFPDVPVAGVIRVWQTGAFYPNIKINGIDQAVNAGTSKASAMPYNVAVGDVIEIREPTTSGNTGYGYILPFVYP